MQPAASGWGVASGDERSEKGFSQTEVCEKAKPQTKGAALRNIKFKMPYCVEFESGCELVDWPWFWVTLAKVRLTSER